MQGLLDRLGWHRPGGEDVAKPFTPRLLPGPIIGHILDVDRCAVWAGMGMGKTSSTLSAIRDLQMVGSTRAGARPRAWLPRHLARQGAQVGPPWPACQIMPVVGSAEERRLGLKHDAPVYHELRKPGWLVRSPPGDRMAFETMIRTRPRSPSSCAKVACVLALKQVAHQVSGSWG